MAATPPPKLNLRQLTERGERPFPSHPQVARYFPAAAMENARRRLSRAIDRGDGPGLIIGGPGTGKSLLLQVLAAQFHQRFDIVLLACARLCTRRALLQAILFELGLPYRLRDEGQLRFSVLDHLLSAKQSTSELLLLVDEAQALPVTLLDELRVLTNLVHGGSPRVRLVMAGSPALEESFASPELESFSQRLAARCYLTPLARTEATQFIRAQMAASGADVEAVLTADACEAVFEATDGVPRLVNQLCDHSIATAVEQNCLRLDRRIVQTAWSNLQQLPSPTESLSSSTVAAASAVEFGRLDAEPPPGGLRIHSDEPDTAGIDEAEFNEVEIDIVVVNEPLSPHVPLSSHVPFQQHPLPPAATKEKSNPFAEPFADEEIVLDQFAPWGDMFHRGTPRVDNVRDRQMTGLVQQALDTTGGRRDIGEPSITREATRTDRRQADEDDLPTHEEPSDEADFRWPPLRLTDALESSTAPHVEAVSPAHLDPGVNSPIVIIEDDVSDDAPMGNPATFRPEVRRQEYRRLFTRLRSG